MSVLWGPLLRSHLNALRLCYDLCLQAPIIGHASDLFQQYHGPSSPPDRISQLDWYT